MASENADVVLADLAVDARAAISNASAAWHRDRQFAMSARQLAYSSQMAPVTRLRINGFPRNVISFRRCYYGVTFNRDTS